MTALSDIARFPEVTSVVAGDLNGAVLECIDEPEGEVVASVMGFVVSLLSMVGRSLGVGPVARIAINGATRSCIVTVQGQTAVTAFIGPKESVGTMIKKLETVIPT